MAKPKFVKPLLIGVACTIPVGTVIGLSINWDNTQFISAVGSSGVKPFIESFGKLYHEHYSNFDVTVESGGTAFAIEQVAQGYANIGNASNNPYYTIADNKYDWDNKKTFTLGWEGLVIMYSYPNNLSDKAKKNIEVVINKENIAQLYAVFSGWYELASGKEWKDEWSSLLFYVPDSIKSSFSTDDIKLLHNTKILPFVRSGGNTGANSSIAFTYYSNLMDFDDLTERQRKAFEGGQYGTDGPNMETDESNARAWQSFVAKDQAGSMTYLTTSFLTESNLQLMNKYGYKLAKVEYDGTETSVLDAEGKLNLDVIATNGGYNWYRPINAMIDLDVDKSKDFIYWIYFGKNESPTTEFSDDYSRIVKAKGAKPLSFDDFDSMLVRTGTMKEKMFDASASDIELAKKTRTDHPEVYGAIEQWKE